jgi:hypothetical protein
MEGALLIASQPKKKIIEEGDEIAGIFTNPNSQNNNGKWRAQWKAKKPANAWMMKK